MTVLCFCFQCWCLVEGDAALIDIVLASLILAGCDGIYYYVMVLKGWSMCHVPFCVWVWVGRWVGVCMWVGVFCLFEGGVSRINLNEYSN